ncbi:division plane positioning ATPase MipZ [Pelagerythrobacter marensis]|uniref:division plane positioning ATPase MipZ n=1 Tax=Pelagerythrobacter marensis TaxID=543877 RepID=UPI001F4724A1|nr:division plane positioning ATPase MipZ [Pelagerythrobacter marensis]
MVADVAAHVPAGKVITFANEKGGVGKSTLALHCAVSLAHSGFRVVAIDLDARQATLDQSLCFREGTARVLGVDLPMPRHAILHRPAAAQLQQEINRLDATPDFVVLDAPGADSPIFRRAVAAAETLVTPINASFADLQVLGRTDPVSGRPGAAACFGRTVAALRNARRDLGLAPIDWLVAKNRVRMSERRQIDRVDAALSGLAKQQNFRIGHGLSERVAFRELFQFGLTHLDLRLLPDMVRASKATLAEIERLTAELFPAGSPATRAPAAPTSAPTVRASRRARSAYREALAAAAHGTVNPCI